MIASLADLTFLDDSKVLGSGSYSTVFKVLNNNDNKVYALKKAV